MKHESNGVKQNRMHVELTNKVYIRLSEYCTMAEASLECDRSLLRDSLPDLQVSVEYYTGILVEKETCLSLVCREGVLEIQSNPVL